MDVHKYEAFTMQDAIKLVKKELGRDAVILSTREKVKTPEGSSKPIRLIEVTAAPAAAPKSKTSQASTRSGILSPEEAARAQRIDFTKVSQTSDTIRSKQSPALGQLNPATRSLAKSLAGALEPAPNNAINSVNLALQQRSYEQGLVKVDTQAQARALRTQDHHLKNVSERFDDSANTEIRSLRDELGKVRREIELIPHVNVSDQMQEIRVLLHDLMRQRFQKDTDNMAGNDVCLNDICIRLRAAGVLEAVISELSHIVTTGPLPTHPDGSPLIGEKLKEHYLNQSIRFLFRQMSVTPQANFSNQKVVALVGSTGVGKTTTIAKLAARMQLTDKKRVALISMDSFRIAAADQLRAYSKILDCPFSEVTENSDLAEFVTKFYDYDLILIDTAGRSSKQQMQMDQLRSLSNMPFPVHFHMVQSASMKQRDLDENLKAFRMVNLQSLIFTKLDESWSFGEILNTNITSKLPLSFFTTGQKVPEDLEPATKERVVERIFRL
ncbi:MAG: hypothetical protein RJB13_1796 [Pseudomonadota bacterium]